ncbi:hypothetical protein GOBAR_AA02755 [Gossypium barbadense]|uniref:ADF-H domain-containing protein n=1 Tax=Gossypium barbadense TaxID=3634 RepID=A0A2P5YQG9_GOSBA|nr:hypothetical protein GOBAR_AA02755 [Gossypium barbadense]
MWVTDECKNSFMEMKWKKVHRYIVFKIDEKSRLVTVDKVGGPGESYDDLTASLPIDDCRYAVFDFDFVTVDNCRKSKLFFIACYQSKFSSLKQQPTTMAMAFKMSPAASRIRAKMLYATSKDGLRRVLDGISYEVQATDPTEMGIDVIKHKAN